MTGLDCRNSAKLSMVLLELFVLHYLKYTYKAPSNHGLLHGNAVKACSEVIAWRLKNNAFKQGRVSCAFFFCQKKKKKKELTEKAVSLSSLALGFSYHKVFMQT